MSVTSMAQITFKLDGELERRFEEYRDAQELKPNKSKVVRAALDEYLGERGY